MKLSRINIVNYKLFEDLDLSFSDSNMNVIVGANGAGKTTILDAIAMTMAHIEGGYSSDSDAFQVPMSISKSEIQIGKTEAVVECFYQLPGEYLVVSVSKHINQSSSSHKFDPEQYFKDISEKLIEKRIEKLPILSYYNISRNFTQWKLGSNKYFFNPILGGYENSMSADNSPFVDFEEWFIEQENLENEIKVNENIHFELPQLKIARKVISELFSKIKSEEFITLVGRRKSNNPKKNASNIEQGVVLRNKNKEEIHIKSLSSGEQNIIFLFADIARRLCILNSNSPNSLEGNGIVLIDELELHLHPKWQRYIVSSLSNIFPNVQFFITTHSPQILSGVKSDQIIVLSNGKTHSIDASTRGRDSNALLEEVFGSSSRPADVTKIISNVYTAAEQKDMQVVNEHFTELKSMVGKEDPIILRIENTLRRLELLKK